MAAAFLDQKLPFWSSRFNPECGQFLVKTTRPEKVDGQSVPVKSASILVA
jgi:hypothetical protein